MEFSFNLFKKYKWRAELLRSILVRIISHISEVHDLEKDIDTHFSEMKKLRAEIEQISKSKDLKTTKVKKNKIKKAHRLAHKKDQALREIGHHLRAVDHKVIKFAEKLGKNLIQAEKDLEKVQIEDDTLTYREFNDIEHIFKLVTKLKKHGTISAAEEVMLKNELVELEKHIKSKQNKAYLEAKRDYRGAINHIVLSEISPRSSPRIMLIIKRNAIEIGAVTKDVRLKKRKLKSAKSKQKAHKYFKDLAHDYRMEISDLEQISNLGKILLDRMHNKLRNIRGKLNIKGLEKAKKHLERVQRHFNEILENVVKQERRLWIEIKPRGEVEVGKINPEKAKHAGNIDVKHTEKVKGDTKVVDLQKHLHNIQQRQQMIMNYVAPSGKKKKTA